MLPITDLRTQSDQDSGPALVLLHVFGGSRRYWMETGLQLSAKARVISIDTPGFGEARTLEGYSVEAMAEAFAATIAGLQLDSFTLVGHSMTGKVAAVLAARGLPGLDRLALVTPSPLGPEPIPDEARSTMLAQAAGTLEHARSYVRSNSALPVRGDVFERAVEDRLLANPDAWRAWLDSGSREDWSRRVEAVDVPTLVVSAGQDRTLGPEVQRELTIPHFSNARMEVITESGHLVPLEAPDRLATLLHEFAAR